MPLDFLRLLETLVDSGLEFVIVGGVAARLYGNPRLTHDVDIVPRLDQEAWARAIDSLWEMGGRPRIPEPLERVRDVAQVARWIADKGMLALSFRSPDGSIEVDFLVGESQRFGDLCRRSTTIELGARIFRVAAIDDLIAMKQKAGRPQDLLDADALRQIKARSSQG